MHLLNAEIDISTKAKSYVVCSFLVITLYDIVRLLYVLICIIKCFFLLKGINIATLYKGSFLDFYFFYIKNSKQWEYHCQIVYKISTNSPWSMNLFLQTFHTSFMKKVTIYYAERVYFYAIPH